MGSEYSVRVLGPLKLWVGINISERTRNWSLVLFVCALCQQGSAPLTPAWATQRQITACREVCCNHFLSLCLFWWKLMCQQQAKVFSQFLFICKVKWWLFTSWCVTLLGVYVIWLEFSSGTSSFAWRATWEFRNFFFLILGFFYKTADFVSWQTAVASA